MLNWGINIHIFFNSIVIDNIIQYLMGNSKKPLPLGLQSLGISVTGWEEGEGEGNKNKYASDHALASGKELSPWHLLIA